LDSASSFSAALSAVPIEIPRLVLEGIAPARHLNRRTAEETASDANRTVDEIDQKDENSQVRWLVVQDAGQRLQCAVLHRYRVPVGVKGHL
jgi:hypothetical protein